MKRELVSNPVKVSIEICCTPFVQHLSLISIEEYRSVAFNKLS